jgi:hypothetical protein
VVTHYLGLLAAVLGRAERADACLADALARYQAMGARPFIARVLVDRARVALASRARVRAEVGGDPARAMLEQAAAIAGEIGMDRCARTAERLLADLAEQWSAPTGAAPRPLADVTSGCLFRREGNYWTIVYGGSVTRIKDTKGLRYLGELLRAPGRDFHVLDLLGLDASPEGSEARPHGTLARAGDGDAGPVLDAHARTEYRRRIAELRTELAEAEGHGDLGRVEHSRAELEQLMDQLAGAVGLGGRNRRAADAAERARLNVTRAIRSVVARIRFANPALAGHLDNGVVTGRFCRYEPRRESAVDWSF